jgi:predicted nuclease of predicted toxin-antitoxin system
VRLLLDNNLSIRLGAVLEKEGWDVVHLRSLGLQAASDRVVLDRARADARVLVSADTDFGGLLAASHESATSAGRRERRPAVPDSALRRRSRGSRAG